jgi:two-component system NtrC family response regulator
MYRINPFEIHLPALRERIQDVPDLARYLLARMARNRGKQPLDALIADDAIDVLLSHVWPGNVRELANVIEHATILCDSGPIRAEHLPQQLASRRDLEMEAILESLERNDGNKPKAAEELGISLKTLYNKLNQVTTLEASA